MNHQKLLLIKKNREKQFQHTNRFNYLHIN